MGPVYDIFTSGGHGGWVSEGAREFTRALSRNSAVSALYSVRIPTRGHRRRAKSAIDWIIFPPSPRTSFLPRFFQRSLTRVPACAHAPGLGWLRGGRGARAGLPGKACEHDAYSLRPPLLVFPGLPQPLVSHLRDLVDCDGKPARRSCCATTCAVRGLGARAAPSSCRCTCDAEMGAGDRGLPSKLALPLVLVSAPVRSLSIHWECISGGWTRYPRSLCFSVWWEYAAGTRRADG